MPLSYTVTYDPDDTTTVLSDVRFAIQDVDVLTNPPSGVLPRSQWSVLFTDQEILKVATKYAAATNQADMTAAELLEDIASNTALLAKHIVLGDYQSDTRVAAKGLRDQADWLRNRAGKAAAAGADEPAESISEEIWTDFDYRRELFTNAIGQGQEVEG
jgi:hypothetical protein